MSTEPINDSDAAAIIAAVQQLAGCQKLELNGRIVAAVPGGDGKYALQSVKPLLDEYLDAPERIVGSACLESRESFVDYVKMFSGLETKIFATEGGGERPGMVAIIDHHHKGPTPKAQFCKHRARYDFPLSDEWKAWKKMDQQVMTQVAFAHFVQERIADFTSPEGAGSAIKQFASDLEITLATPAKMLDLSRGLRVRVNQKAVERPNITTGEVELLFTEEHTDDAGNPLRVPEAFALAIPVFKDDQLDLVGAHLRRRIEGGKALWLYQLHRPDLTFRNAFRTLCAAAAAATSLPLFYGTPEN